MKRATQAHRSLAHKLHSTDELNTTVMPGLTTIEEH